ncbi:MAG TPA: cation:proton antiporter [bacterium]|nr:cation:proton antiporter [bacterium]
MPHGESFLISLAVVLGVAALTTVIFQRLKQPVVLGYLLAGFIVGPHTSIPVFADESLVHELAELGVILLMFSIGLEFRLGTLIKLGPTAGIIAVLQCALMICLGYAVGRAFGWTSLQSLYVGAIIAISSTTIIAKVFEERGIRGRFAELVYGILIVEDLIAILLLAMFEAISAGRSLSVRDMGSAVGMLGLFLVALMAVGMLVVPRLMRFVVRMGKPESTLIASVGLCFSVALLAKYFGYSVALGAFMAGALVAESGETHAIEPVVKPVRDVFSAVFFVAVGMMIDPVSIAKNWPAVLAFTLLAIGGKFVGVFLGAFLTGFEIRTSVRAGLSLAQIGEFSFIIAGVAVAGGGGKDLYSLAIAVSGLTTLTTPWLIRASDSVARAIDRKLPRSLQTFAALYGSWIGNLSRAGIKEIKGTRRYLVLILIDIGSLFAIFLAAAYARERSVEILERWLSVPQAWTGTILLALAAALAVPFVVGIVRCCRGLGASLDLAPVPRKVFVVTLQLGLVLVIGSAFLAVSPSFLPLPIGLSAFGLGLAVLAVMFWRNAESLQGHVTAGAKLVLEVLSSQAAPDSKSLSRTVEQVLPGLGTLFSFPLAGSNRAVGKTLAEINLRGMTGASVIAIKRGATDVTVPSGHETLQSGDVLVLTGSEAAIEAAKEFLA